VEQSVVGRNCRIGKGVEMLGCYIMDDATVQVREGGRAGMMWVGKCAFLVCVCVCVRVCVCCVCAHLFICAYM